MRKNIFITGGASGIGLQLAKYYLKGGHNVALFDLSFSESVLEELYPYQGASQNLVSLQADVCDMASLSGQVEAAVNTLGSPDLVINCAGILRAGRFTELPQSEFEQVVAINLFGTRNFICAVLPFMKKGAHVSMISSMAGVSGVYTYAAYCASKFGVMGLAKVLRQELKPRGIDVSVICPPEVSTPMVVKEHQTIDPICLEQKMVAGVLTVEEAVSKIAAGLATRKHVVVPGFRAKIIYLINRFAPDSIMFGIVDRIIAKGLARQSQTPQTDI